MSAAILVVDDEPGVRSVLRAILERDGYRVATAENVAAGKALVASYEPELVLADVAMPDDSGLALAAMLAEPAGDTAVLMMSGKDDRASARAAVELGAYGFLAKPFKPVELLVAVENALRRRKLERRARAELRRAREETIRRLAATAEARDHETGAHIERMSRSCAAIARRLGLDAERAELIRLAGSLHDIGKLAIPDRILLKPGRLTADERAAVERHPEAGHALLTGSGEELLELAATIAFTHHERLDGSGYPRGLRGAEIPLEGRIAAVADVYDALTHDRVYRAALAPADALAELVAGSGRSFDSAVVDALVATLEARA